MSLRAMLAVLELSESTLATRLVALALADNAHDDGSNAFPSIATLAKKSKTSRKTVQRSLDWLAAECEIVCTGRTPNEVRVWHFTIVEPLAFPVTDDQGGWSSTTDVPLYREPSSNLFSGQNDHPPLDEPTPLELVANVLASRSTRDVSFVRWLRGVGPILADSPRNFADELASTWGVRSPGVVEIYRQVALGATIEDLKDEGRGFE